MTVSQLAVRYAHAVDQRDAQTLAALFTEDAVFVLDPAMARPDQPTQWRGRDEIAAGVLGGVTGLIATRHEICGQVLDEAAGTATARTYCQAHHIFERKGTPTDEVMAVQYLDEYVEVDGHWRIARRELVLDYTWREEVRLPARP